jgi:hypothetical protein
MVNAKIDIFEMPYAESVFYFKYFENFEMIRRTSGSARSSVDDKTSVTSNVFKSSKNPNSSKIWCNYCDKNNYNTSKERLPSSNSTKGLL